MEAGRGQSRFIRRPYGARAPSSAGRRSGEAVGVNLQTVGNDVSIAQAAIAKLPPEAQAAWGAATSTAAAGASIALGAVNLAELAKNGYDPDNSADNQKLVGVIAAGVSCIPGVGPVLGGCVEALYQIGELVGDALTALGVFWTGCRSSGNWTTSQILNGFITNGATLEGFGAIAWPAIAADTAAALNCKPSYGPECIVQGLAILWNQQNGGTPVPCWWPANGGGINYLGDAYGTVTDRNAQGQITAQGAGYPALASIFQPTATNEPPELQPGVDFGSGGLGSALGASLTWVGTIELAPQAPVLSTAVGAAAAKPKGPPPAPPRLGASPGAALAGVFGLLVLAGAGVWAAWPSLTKRYPGLEKELDKLRGAA